MVCCMQNGSVYQWGIRFISACLDYYNGMNAYLVYYVASLLFVGLKGDRKVREIFLPSGIMLLLTVYNPFFPILIDRFFDINKEYYRFFWLTPITILVPYGGVSVLEMEEGKKKMAAAFALTVILIFTGDYIYKNGYTKAENPYKVPNEVIEVSRMLHQVSEVETPKAMMEYDFNMMMRQYDPSILLAVGREDYINGVTYEITEEQMNSKENGFLYRLVAVMMRGEELEKEKFLEALEGTNTEFFVISKGNLIQDYLIDMGLTKAGETKGHILYRYNVKERENPYVDNIYTNF